MLLVSKDNVLMFYGKDVNSRATNPEDPERKSRVFSWLSCETRDDKGNRSVAGGVQFTDLAGDGQLDVVVLDGPTPGFREHDEPKGRQPFRPFTARRNRDTEFVDPDGDGLVDLLITENDASVWHAPVLGRCWTMRMVHGWSSPTAPNRSISPT